MAPVPGTLSSAAKSFGLGIELLPSNQTSLTGPRWLRAGNSKVIFVAGG
jgi:hypothetical protein